MRSNAARAFALVVVLLVTLQTPDVHAQRLDLPFVQLKNASGAFRHFRNGLEAIVGISLNGSRVYRPEKSPPSTPHAVGLWMHGANATRSDSSVHGSPGNPHNQKSPIAIADSGKDALSGLASLSQWEAVFNAKFETNAMSIAEKYPKQEVERIPWPSGDWPVYRDGINHQWNKNEPSAPAKFARVKGLDLNEFERLISDDGGVEYAEDKDHGGSCWSDDDCGKEPYLYLCGKANDSSEGLCIPRYYGICDGWTSASLVEEEPKCPVTINDVTFRVLDIKALLSLVYTASKYNYNYALSGKLCAYGTSDSLDKFGRYAAPERRDVDPHVFHTLLANVIGRFRKSLILDIDPGIPIFNYALRSYSIQETRLMKPDDAASRYFKIPSYNEINPDAVQLQYVKMSVNYIHEGYEDGPLVSNPEAIDRATKELVYEYLLELDGSHEIIGGEWVNDSKKQHPDIVWHAYTKMPNDAVSDAGITYEFVSDLLKKSLQGSC